MRRTVFRAMTVCAMATMGLMDIGVGIAHGQTSDAVIYASDVGTLSGNWSKVGSSSGANGVVLSSADRGWATTDAPQSSPSDYFEATFSAQANTRYHVWLRLRAGGNSKWNDSVWAQFSDAVDQNGSPVFRIQSTSGLLLNLEGCSGCGVNGWGWKDGAYWLSQASIVKFASSGTHTIRVQTREDGIEIDQIVVSASNYMSNGPGQGSGDATIVPKSGSGSPSASTPYSGSAAVIPGTIAAQNFDNGGEGVAYHDLTGANEGGAYRQTGVDLAASTDGGNCVGWISAGEWLNYSVNVGSAGAYTVTFRVASAGNGGTFHLEMNGSNVSGAIGVPNTGGWQNWVNLNVNVNLSGGQQIARLVMDTVGASGAVANINSMRFTGGSSSGGGTQSPYAGVIQLPGTVQTENFDNGGEGVSYHDSSSGNSGGAFRSTDVDLEPSSGGGYNLGYVVPGEWLKYSVNVASSGTYTLSVRVASSGPGGAFHVEMNGSTVASFTVPNTGGWQNWQTLSTSVSLSGGQQTARLVMDSASPSVGNFDWLQISTAAAAPPPSGGGGGTFRVMQWNIQHGRNSSGTYNLDQQVQFMVSQNPDVITLQEVQTWDENQPARLQQLLQQMTGQAWTVVWAPVVNTAGTEGNVVLTRLPVSTTQTFQMHATGDYSVLLANRSAAMARVRVGGIDVNLISTHLDYANTAYRTIQLAQLMPWIAGLGGPRLVGGDFNSWWGEQWILNMESQHSDTWRDVTGSNENGYTVNAAVRFDYIFRAFDGNNRVAPTNCFVPATSLSDHYPVIADFRVQ